MSTADMNDSVQGSRKTLRSSAVGEYSAYTLDGSIPVHLRRLQKPTGLPSLAGLASSRLNRTIFPEARLMFNVIQDNLNRFYGIQYNSSKTTATFDGLFAYHPKSSIRSLLEDLSLAVEHEMKLLFLADVVNGLGALHDAIGPHGFLHSNNLLLDERYTVKITDYGLQKFRDLAQLMPVVALGLDEDYILTKLVFRAPELLRAGYLTSEVLTTKSDVYSLAMLFVEIMTRQAPFSSDIDKYNTSSPPPYLSNSSSANANSATPDTAVAILEAILKITNSPKRPTSAFALCGDDDKTLAISAPLQQLIERCWVDEAANRPTLKEVLRAVKHLPGYRSGNVMETLVKRLEKYAKNLQSIVDERTRALSDEMKKSEGLLFQILPHSVANELRCGRQVLPETFDSVSIYFSDIADFSAISLKSTPMQIVNLLNELYTVFDSTLSKFDVYKVETIGDSYMVASGIPHRNGLQHCVELADMSLVLMEQIRTKCVVSHRPGRALALRVGLHTGACVAGVVGLKMPRYCLFGDTVNMASRMESNSLPFKIHTSEQFYLATMERTTSQQVQQFVFELRGQLQVKGKGTVTTYWLLEKNSPSTSTADEKTTSRTTS